MDVRAKFCIQGAECLLGQTRPETAENSSAGPARLNLIWGVAKIFTSGHSKGGFDRTPRTPLAMGVPPTPPADILAAALTWVE